MSFIFFISIYILIFYSNVLYGEKCQKSDLEFQYTECDKTGHRWLVNVPKSNRSCDITSDFKAPKVARNCGDPCSPGTYLDIETQECKDCASGTYSQGDSIEISNWKDLPPGFHTVALDNKREECKREQWIANGNFISTTVSYCESFLQFTASLYKPGELQFKYQMSGEGAFFEVKVVHDECQSKIDDNDSISTIKFMDPTSESAWVMKVVPLKTGRNVITWTVTGIDSERSVVKINHLQITNSIFSSQCTNCSAGYFSSKRSSICSPCSMNTFSDHPGSDQCTECPVDHYSMPGSKSCTKKVSCTSSDYSYKWTDCDKNNHRRKVFSWIEPKLCSETVANSVKLPPNSVDVPCEPCPIGTFLNTSSQQCQFCPEGSAVLKSGDVCTKCSPNTKPVPNINYDKWAHMLPNLTSLCIKGIGGDCKSEQSWIYNGDNLQSSMFSDVHLLRLEFQTIEKSTYSKSDSQSLFEFEFSMNCTGYCVLRLYLKLGGFVNTRINTWLNSTSRTKYQHHVPLNRSGKFVWLFSHHTNDISAQKSTDHVKIYSIRLSDLRNVGALDCRNCDPSSINNGSCVDCDNGKYFSKDSHKCEFCPRGHVLKNHPGQSIDDCERCGDGLVTNDSVSCQPSMTFVSTSNNVYDLSKLKGHHLLRGNQLFNTHGQQYVHVFNLTLFSDHGDSMSLCRNNMSSTMVYDDDLFYVDGIVEVRSPMCRVTMVVDKSQNNTLYSVQIISLAETYQKIAQSNSSIDYWKELNNSLINHGFAGDDTGLDLHVYLASPRKTDICVNGRLTVVTIRCDKTVIGAQLLPPSKCPVETCDGCNFHFLLKSQDACPFCRPEDFTVITEECMDGQQKRHFHAPRYCNPQLGSKSTVTIKCPLVTMRSGIIAIATAGVLIFLVGLIVYCYQKNKKLEYKYMHLIGANDDNEHAMDASESCGIHDGDNDDEDDDFKVKTSSKPGQMFARFNKQTRNRRDDNGMETVNLNDNAEYDI